MPQLSASGYYYPANDGAKNYLPLSTPMSVTGSASFSANALQVVFGPVSILKYDNYKVSLINNSSNNLLSGTVEVSPDNANWEVLNSASFAALTSSAMASYQATGLSNNYLRVRAQSSGAAGSNTGSLLVVLVANAS